MADKILFANEPSSVSAAWTFNGAVSHVGAVGFYGVAPPAQRASNSTLQRTSLLAAMATTSGSLFDGTNLATINQAILALQEVMNTLAAHGLWAIS